MSPTSATRESRLSLRVVGLALAAVAVPWALFLWLLADRAHNTELVAVTWHFLATTNISLLALIAALQLVRSAGRLDQPSLFLVALGFATMAAFFTVHGLATPGMVVLAPGSEARGSLSGLSAQLSLFVPSLLFAGAGWRRLRTGGGDGLPMLGIAVGVSALFGAYVLLATFATEDLGKTPLSYPPLSSGLAVLTIALLVVAAGVQLFGRSPAPGTLRFFLAISFLMLAEAQISLAIAPPWTLAWWEYHGLMASAVGLALASLHWDLDRRQVAREAEQQAQLVAAQSEAEAARRAEALKRDVIAIVSHELRTPLTAVRGFSELLLTRNVSEQQRELWLQTMYQETTAIATMLDELLDVSRLEDGALPLDIEAVALGETIERVATGFRAEGSAYQILVELPASEVMVLADRDRLAQILQNLVSNAIKYSPGGGEVRISASQSGANALVQVRDRGLGIPAHEIERLFSRFHRVHSPERVSIRGTGLGLFITQQLVARQGGEIWAESQTEEGSTFSFTLPLAPATQR